MQPIEYASTRHGAVTSRESYSAWRARQERKRPRLAAARHELRIARLIAQVKRAYAGASRRRMLRNAYARAGIKPLASFGTRLAASRR